MGRERREEEGEGGIDRRRRGVMGRERRRVKGRQEEKEE